MVDDFGTITDKKPCPACRGRKVEKQPITLSDLQRLLKKTEASADDGFR
jgi:hypothetical protein